MFSPKIYQAEILFVYKAEARALSNKVANRVNRAIFSGQFLNGQHYNW